MKFSDDVNPSAPPAETFASESAPPSQDVKTYIADETGPETGELLAGASLGNYSSTLSLCLGLRTCIVLTLHVCLVVKIEVFFVKHACV